MNAPARFPPATLLHTLSRFDRDQLAGFIAVAIDLLDFADGDADLEMDDHGEEDDPSGQCDEDDVNTSLDVLWERRGAGCIISDDDASSDDDGGPVR